MFFHLQELVLRHQQSFLLMMEYNINKTRNEAGEEIQATPDVELSMEDDSVTINDDLVVTASSTIKLLRDAYRWLKISQAGATQRMFDRCKKAKELALRRSLIESAREQYKSQSLDAIQFQFPNNRVIGKRLYPCASQTMVQVLCDEQIKGQSTVSHARSCR